MTEQAARLSSPCPGCGKPCTGWAVQLTRRGRLRWELEWACDECGISHEGGWGPAPAEIREVILAQHGPYCLDLADSAARSGRILKAFRAALDISIREAQEFANKLQSGGYEGTFVETQLVSDLLQRDGIPSVVHPGPCV
jgi:hypothetical protein